MLSKVRWRPCRPGLPSLQWMQGNSALVGYFTVAEVACHHCGLACVKRELLSALFKLVRHTDR